MSGVGTNIAANDYNAIQGAIASLLGTGIGGYGQTVYSGQVSTSGTILASQWQALLTDIAAVNYHQLNAAPRYNGAVLTVPSNGTGVSTMVGPTTYTNASPAVKVKEADRAAYLAVARALVSPNPSTVGSINYPGCYTTTIDASQLTTVAVGSYIAPSVRVGSSSPWGNTSSGSRQPPGGQAGTINMVVTLTFPSDLAAQYYFNTGGSVLVSGSATAGQSGTAGTKDQSWSILLSNMGNMIFNYKETKSTGAGSGTNYGWSYFNSNRNVTQTIYTITTSSSLYAPNQADVLCNLNSAGTVLTFTFQLQDLSTVATKVASGAAPGDTNLYSIDTPVTATIAGNITISYASGSYVTALSPSSILPIPVIITPFTA